MARPFFLTLALCGATLAIPLGSIGCGGEEEGPVLPGGSGQGGDASMLPYEPCPAGADVGGFTIALTSEDTSVDGQVFDGVLAGQAESELARAGECRLVKPYNPLCDPPCTDSSLVCAENNQCLAMPRSSDLGTVTVQGLVVPLRMTPKPNKSYSDPAVPRLPHPGFEPGADLRIVTGGGDYAPFELRGWGVSLLELDPVRVNPGQPTAITWLASQTMGPTRVRASLDINVHGSNRARIDCDFPDTGAGEIPAVLIDGLIAEGTTGNPTLTMTRETATSRVIESGCVEMRVISALAQEVDVEGIITCDDSSPCPEGLSCIPVELLCE